MKKLALTLGVLALSATTAFAQQTVRMGTEGAYPPYNMINDKGEVDGFERELGDELCKRAELTCTWVSTDWDSIIPNLTAGNYDTILAGMSITEERKAVLNFSQAYFPPSASAFAALSADADLKGVIAAQTGTIQASHVATTGATLLEFATPDETVAAVRNGEADAALADKDFLVPIVNESNGELVWVGEDIPLGEGIGIGFRKSDDELKGKFDKAIDSMKADGSLNVLIKKWFGDEANTF
ncbi:transporter substrate-binding domain-containing protein [Falsigemmobacter intermedius]|uniref:Transporter substrate-binding domain-containing protein n=1 Tax=Falsigemmobacter intermedius TaxID=1553448 RepID=A0A3S3UA32_9RHOB|nr:transporter substrate-binding domain-containing protein [Falsigemmobacter intermedius]RWY42359.1 transporter substrate-binding domain-containing protein [Falsigemmobacter intermedius]